MDNTHIENQEHTNRLIDEKSPYLLQHAYNPVDWYPWGKEAFETAAKKDKPIFLSIGYSTCHWCHVMEHESFEDPEVAQLMNDAFVCIKVDREERPDIDGIYMTVCQMLTGSGGWPLTVILTPDRKPFFAGTYFPKESAFGRIGMLDLVPRVRDMWQSKREDLLSDAQRIVGALAQRELDSEGKDLDESTLRTAYGQLASHHDPVNGGFSTSPKFPTPHNLLFLLRYWKRTGNPEALGMVELTLAEMRKGGIYDHVGFGFHRYSTDAEWLVPHFEKMLYDQALIAAACIEAYQATGKELFKQTAEEIFKYVLRDMTDPEGGFYSAEDADSEGVEGKFYVWTVEEILAILGEEDGKLACRIFNASSEGNFLEESTGHKTGANILHLKASPQDLSGSLGIPEEELSARRESIRTRLFEVREKRIHPYKDDKILMDWNGLMISSFAKGGQAFGNPVYVQAAAKAARFMLEEMRTPKGRLLHRFREGEAAIAGHLDDYAFLIAGLLDLYEATFDVSFLETAVQLNRDTIEHFWDEEGGGFFFTADDAEELLIRQKEVYDGAIPSGNSVAALNLIRLARFTGDTSTENKAHNIFQAFSGQVGRMPSVFTQMMLALDFALGPSYEVVLVGDPAAGDTRSMLEALRKTYLPNKVVLLKTAGEADSRLKALAPFTEFQSAVNGKATAYVCLNHACRQPTADVDEMLKSLQ